MLQITNRYFVSVNMNTCLGEFIDPSKSATRPFGSVKCIPVHVAGKPSTPIGTEIDIEFTVKWTQYQWMNPQSELNTISSDGAPVVSKMIFSNLHSGISSHEMDYKAPGIRVVYSIRPIANEHEPNEFIRNTAGNNGDIRPTDTLKVFCFTKAPPTVCTQITKSILELPVHTERKNKLHC